MIIQCIKCDKEKQKEEYYKKSKNKNGYSLACKDCLRKQMREYNIIHKNDIKKYNQNNKELLRAYYHKNKSIFLKNSKKYYIKNREKHLEYMKQYRKNNKGRINSLNIRNKKNRKKSLHPQRNEKIIKVFYDMSNRLSKCLGIKFNVDHIFPISKGGWHHEENLQVITEVLNKKKSAKTDFFLL
jgi:hypothetical protein